MPKRKSKNWRNGNFGSIIRSEASIPKIEQSRSLEENLVQRPHSISRARKRMTRMKTIALTIST